MSKIDLKLDYSAVINRINKEKQRVKPTEWARMVGVSKNIVSNVHGKMGQKPSIEYIIAVARATRKPVEYYLWGTSSLSYGMKSEIEAETVPPGDVAEGVAGYKQTSEDDLLAMTKEVLRSGTSYAVSLTANIRSFYEAVQTKKKLEARVENERRLLDHEKRLTALERDRKKALKAEPPIPSLAEGSGGGATT